MIDVAFLLVYRCI